MAQLAWAQTENQTPRLYCGMDPGPKVRNLHKVPFSVRHPLSTKLYPRLWIQVKMSQESYLPSVQTDTEEQLPIRSLQQSCGNRKPSQGHDAVVWPGHSHAYTQISSHILAEVAGSREDRAAGPSLSLQIRNHT